MINTNLDEMMNTQLARLPDETTRLISANFEEADEAVSLFFGYMVSCGFHPGSVTRAMREFLDS